MISQVLNRCIAQENFNQTLMNMNEEWVDYDELDMMEDQ